MTELSFEPDVRHCIDVASTTILCFRIRWFTWILPRDLVPEPCSSSVLACCVERVGLGRHTTAAPSEVRLALELHRTTVPFLPKGSLKTTASHSPGRASVLHGRDLLSGQLSSFKGLRVPAAESNPVHANSRSPHSGEHACSAPRWLPGPDGGKRVPAFKPEEHNYLLIHF